MGNLMQKLSLKKNSSDDIYPIAEGEDKGVDIVGQTRLFNLDMAISLEEEKPKIQTC